MPPKRTDVVAMFVSDIHLSLKPPIARTAEENWLKAQERVINQVAKVQESYGFPPIFIPGDIFHKWDSTAELINFTIWNLAKWKKVHAIPGNHDTPQHNHKDLPKSAYWTLVESKVINHLTYGPTAHEIDQLMVSAFPSGFEVKPLKRESDLHIHIALIHDFIWTEKTKYEGADEKQKYGAWMKKLKYYDVAVFGDNHKSFLIQPEDKAKCKVLNCGALIRRNMDEKDYQPMVGLLLASGSLMRIPLEVEEDKFLEVKEIIESLESNLKIDLDDFADELGKLHNERLDFVKVVERWVSKSNLSAEIKKILLRAVGIS